jgi:stearoyl-CoA desaturase (delta-9 desaturase)
MEFFIYFLYSFLWWQILSITVISTGYHRYFSHRAFKAPIWYEYYVLFLGSLSGSGPLLGWAGVHRLHHNHEDTELDPHSPKYKGLWAVFTSTFDVPAIKHRTVKDLLRNPRVMMFYKYHKYIRIATIVLGLILLPFEWFLILIISPMIYARIGFGLINAFCHDINGGGAKNSHLVNIIAGGDGFHKNHHENPRDWKIGKKWNELDPGAWFISLIRKV